MILRGRSKLMQFLNSPMSVLAACSLVGFLALVLDGTLFRLWTLHRESARVEQNISRIDESSKNLKKQILKAEQMDFVERQARDRFDLVSEDDLVFVFSEEQEM